MIPLGWRTVNPALMVASRLGFEAGTEPAQLMLSAIGGNAPQALMHDACRAISKGELDVVLVTGAEAMYARALAETRSLPRPTLLGQPAGRGDAVARPLRGGQAGRHQFCRCSAVWSCPYTPTRCSRTPCRAARGWSLDEHTTRIGSLWSRFSEVAAANPDAWIRTPRSASEIVTPGPDNRMVSFPYPPDCARPTCRWTRGPATSCARRRPPVPPACPRIVGCSHCPGQTPTTTGSFRTAPRLHRSPAIRLAGAAALELAGIGIDDLAAVDLYSCFPVVVQMAAAELGLSVDDPGRPLTLTGGLTFGGGPGNNYTSHGIAHAIGALRRDPGAGGASSRAWVVRHEALRRDLCVTPPGGRRFQALRLAGDVQPEVDALPQCRVERRRPGRYDRDLHRHLRPRGRSRARGILACRTEDGSRAWGNVDDRDALALLCTEEGIGRTGVLAAGGALSLDG